MWHELSQVRKARPNRLLVLFAWGGSPCASSGQDGAFRSLSINKDGRGDQRTLDFCISWGSLQGFYSWDTYLLFFLFPSFFFLFLQLSRTLPFWTWPFSIWDSSCQLLIFIVVCWLCCIVSERSSCIRMNHFHFLILLICCLFYFECHMIVLFLSATVNISIWWNHTSIHPQDIHLTFFNSTCDFYGFISCLPLIRHSFFIVTAMGEIRPGE